MNLRNKELDQRDENATLAVRTGGDRSHAHLTFLIRNA
jgi:1,4-dihydroxy-2-naphthoate octaprenyltransferase